LTSNIRKRDESSYRPTLQTPSLLQALLKRVLIVVMVLALVNLLTVRLMVDGPSMEPTFYTGQFVLVSRLNYIIVPPQRGQLVVFHLPSNNDQDYLKRVIGLPSETVEMRDERLYINGQLLNESYIATACDNIHCPDGIWQLGTDEYFVVGDNRNNSNDSRYFGAITRQMLVGQVIFRYYPFSEMGFVR
jgi:signal peptidase I